MAQTNGLGPLFDLITLKNILGKPSPGSEKLLWQPILNDIDTSEQKLTTILSKQLSFFSFF